MSKTKSAGVVTKVISYLLIFLVITGVIGFIFTFTNGFNEDFKTFFGAEENLVFYLDGLSSISESFSNSTTDSSLASQINGFADTSNEIRFLFGDKGGALGNIIDTATNATSSIMSSLSSVIGNLRC